MLTYNIQDLCFQIIISVTERIPKQEILDYISGCMASASSRMDWNSTDDKYRSPKLGRITAINFPAFSGLLATSTAAAVAAPEEIPTSKPSFRASCLAISTASLLDTCFILFQKENEKDKKRSQNKES